MKCKLFVGIDPGAKGAIAILNKDGEVVDLYDMPTTNEKYLEHILFWTNKKKGYDVQLVIERVHALPFESAVAGFTFGKNCGKADLLALSMTTGVNPHDVSPQVWKAYFGLKRLNGETKYEYKKRSINKATILFYDQKDKLTMSKDGRAEALLLAKYCLDKYSTCQSA